MNATESVNVELQRVGEAELPTLLPLIGEYHAFEGVDSTVEQREAAARTLLEHPEFGGLWLVRTGDRVAGYIALCRGFSIEFNGFDAFVDELYLAPGYRGRGIGSRVLELIRDEARARGVKALHLEVARDNAPARGLYAKSGFVARDKYVLMSVEIDAAQ